MNFVGTVEQSIGYLCSPLGSARFASFRLIGEGRCGVVATSGVPPSVILQRGRRHEKRFAREWSFPGALLLAMLFLDQKEEDDKNKRNRRGKLWLII